MTSPPANGTGMVEVSSRMTIHHVAGSVLHASRGYEICISTDGGATWKKDGLVPAPLWRRMLDSVSLFKRMSRGGVSFVLPRPDGARLCVAPGRILRAEAGASTYRPVLRLPRGSRPLNLCQIPDGTIYWGEYFLNLRRAHPVRVFRSTDGGRSWDAVFAFGKGSICHIHRIVYDAYDDSVLVCTGDRDEEVAILKTKDGFRTLIPLVQGAQQYRTTSLVPLPEGILYGTDNPRGDNAILELGRGSGRLRRIQPLSGPVLYGCRIRESAAFATMVETRAHEIEVWVGNGRGFRLAASFPSRKGNWLWRELLGYGTVVLPEGTGVRSDLFCTPVGTRTFAGCLIKLMQAY